MTSTGKFNVNSTNLYNRHRGDYVSPNNSSSARRPQQRSHATPTRTGTSSRVYENGTDGEDEKNLLSLSDRIKRLRASNVLKDNGVLSHNNNEPFTYLRTPEKPPRINATAKVNNIESSSRYSQPSSRLQSSRNISSSKSFSEKPQAKTGGQVIYAQVVVDPENRNKNQQRQKRTVHRSYNKSGSSYPSQSPTKGPPPFSTYKPPEKESYTTSKSASNMKGRNVTTVLLNSSSDDIPSSLNIEEGRSGFNGDYRYRSSSSPLLASHDDYYPKSPGIVKYTMQNGHSPSRSRYENHYQRHSTDYLHRQSDDEYEHNFGRERSPFYGRGDTDNSDEYYNYQPVHYGGKSASTNFIDGYGQKARQNYRIDEEDEVDYGIRNGNNSKFEERKSKTLGRDNSFNLYRSRTEEFINRSKTLDNRISSLRERSMRLEEEQRRNKDFVDDGYNFSRPYQPEHDVELTNHKNNAQTAKTKDKSMSTTNIFSTLLRRNKKSDTKGVPQSKSTSVLNTGLGTLPRAKDGGNKKPGHSSSNFFTSFLEKKKKKQQLNADLKKGQAQKGENNTYQSFSNWPSDPPSLSVIDYSNTSPTAKPYYGESNIDTEDTSHGSDIWKKSYGNDMTKVKRRWTMREPMKPSMIQEEEDYKPRYTSTTKINSDSIDRRTNRNNFSNERETYDSGRDRFYGESGTYLKVPDSTGGKFNTLGSRYSQDKPRYQSSQKFDEYDGYNVGTLTKRGRSSEKLVKGYGGGGFAGTPISSGSESNPRMANGSNRSVFLHEPAVIPEMPRTLANGSAGGGGGASISGMSGRRTLSKDEISNYSGSRKEAKQLSRSMSIAHPWGPNKTYKERFNEIDYSRTNNLNLPPRPPSRSPSGSLGLHSRQTGSSVKSSRSPPKTSGTSQMKPARPPLPARGVRKPAGPSSSVESLLRQDSPEEKGLKKGSTKLGRSKSMSVSQSNASRDNAKPNRFSTLWFNKRNSNK